MAYQQFTDPNIHDIFLNSLHAGDLIAYSICTVARQFLYTAIMMWVILIINNIGATRPNATEQNLIVTYPTGMAHLSHILESLQLGHRTAACGRSRWPPLA